MYRCAGLMLAALAVAAMARSEPLKVVTTVPPVHCFTLNVAGQYATVESLLPPGGSAHDFQFTFKERQRLDAARLVVINGLGLESWLNKPLKAGRKTVIEAASGFTNAFIDANPHVWLDPLLAAGMVTNILAGLQAADPANAAGYASNATAFVATLHRLDAEIRQGLASITNRAIVTAHDAFPYFARRYDLQVVGTLEEVADLEPSARHLSVLRRLIQQHQVRALFVDSHHSRRRVNQLASDLKVKVGVLDTLESSRLTATAYEEGMRANLRALQQTLP